MSVDRLKRYRPEDSDEDLQARSTSRVRTTEEDPCLVADDPLTWTLINKKGGKKPRQQQSAPQDQEATQSSTPVTHQQEPTDLPPPERHQTIQVTADNNGGPPKIIVSPTRGFETAVHLAEAVNQKMKMERDLTCKQIIFLTSGQVLLTPPNQEASNYLLQLQEVDGIQMKLRATGQNISKGVLLRYPILMSLTPIERSPPRPGGQVMHNTHRGTDMASRDYGEGAPPRHPGALKLGNLLYKIFQQGTTALL